MSWKENLGIQSPECEIEEEVDFIFNKEIDQYFKDLDFYENTMDPRFFDGYDPNVLETNSPVLRFDGNWDWDNSGVQRVFMNQREIYVERQTSYRSFDGSSYYRFETPPTSIEEIEEVLNKVVRKYNR